MEEYGNNINLSVDINSMHYAVDQTLIKDFKFNFKEGKIYTLLGRNGSGKTSLFRILSGLEQDYEGSVKLYSQTLNKPTRKIQVVFQDNRLFPWMTIKENLLFTQKTENSSIIRRNLENFNLVDKINSYPKDLSGGEEARISILLTFMNPPNILLLDEPFVGLDIESIEISKANLLKLKDLHPGTTIIMITHNLSTALDLSDEILFLRHSPLSISKSIENSSEMNESDLKQKYEEYAT